LAGPGQALNVRQPGRRDDRLRPKMHGDRLNA
jgi:hypothetical protein